MHILVRLCVLTFFYFAGDVSSQGRLRMLYMTVLARCTWVNCPGEWHDCAALRMR